MLPDIDYLWSPYGALYENMWQHRGITHSIFFALVVSALVTWYGFDGSYWRGFRLRIWAGLALAAVSHGLLDSLTVRVGGVALLAPFSARRFYFAWGPFVNERPQAWAHSEVRRLMYGAFIEIVCVWLPALVLLGGTLWAQRSRRTAPPGSPTST